MNELTLAENAKAEANYTPSEYELRRIQFSKPRALGDGGQNANALISHPDPNGENSELMAIEALMNKLEASKNRKEKRVILAKFK